MMLSTIRLIASRHGVSGRTLVTASRRISSSANSQKNELFLPLLAVASVAIGGTILLASEVRPSSGL
jgi:uncharacterized membrane protein